MAAIDISSTAAPLNDGVLQLQNGVAMDSTLRNVADQNDTTSPLKLSTSAVQVVSPLRITTDDPSDMYLDCEDGSANNRFNITRNTASQQVNLNFASNPGGSTTVVGGIRTYVDGVNLTEVMKFREDGQLQIGSTAASAMYWDNVNNRLGVGTNAPSQNLDVTGTTQLAYSNGTGILVSGSDVLIRNYASSNNTFKVISRNAGNIVTDKIVTTNGTDVINLNGQAFIKGSGSTSATTSLLVQNSNGQNNFKITDSGSLITATNMTISYTGGASSKNIFYNDSASGWGGFIFNSSLTYSGNVNELLVIATTKNAFKNPLAIGVALDPNDNLPLMSNSAILQADSTTQGFLPPRMTNAQRAAITTPAIGLMVYCTDAVEGLYVYKSTGWTFVI